MEKQFILVKGEAVVEANKYLEREEINFHEEKIPEDTTIFCYTATFSNGWQADIKVCSGQTNCFVDPVLFDENGCEVCVGEPREKLDGIYEFEVQEEGKDAVTIFEVEVVAKMDRDDLRSVINNTTSQIVHAYLSKIRENSDSFEAYNQKCFDELSEIKSELCSMVKERLEEQDRVAYLSLEMDKERVILLAIWKAIKQEMNW